MKSMQTSSQFHCGTVKVGEVWWVSDVPYVAVGFWVLAKPLRFELWGAHEDLSSPSDSPSPLSQGSARRTRRTKELKIYTGLGHRCGVIPYSSVVWWIATWAGDEQYKGRTASRGSILGWGDELLGGVQSPFSLSLSLVSIRCLFQILDIRCPIPLLWGWLVLFIEALVIFPNIEREGSQQR